MKNFQQQHAVIRGHFLSIQLQFWA